MTREETLAMRAGIELDCLVTRELFPYDGYHEYSTNISAAWQVVEKLIEQNLFRSLDYLREQHWRDGKGHWRCRVVCGVKIEFVVAKEAPEAICKAALLTKLEVGDVSQG